MKCLVAFSFIFRKKFNRDVQMEEKSLPNSNNQFDKTMQYDNSLSDAVMKEANIARWEMDIETGNIKFDPWKAEMLGYSSKNFKHYSDFTKLVHPDDHNMMMNAMKQHLQGQSEKYEVDYRIKSQTGKYLWFYDYGQIAKRDSNGKPLSLSGFVKSISERKESEKRLKENDEHLKLLVLGTLDYFFRLKINADGSAIMEYVSDNYSKITEKELSDIQNIDSWKSIIHPEDVDELFKQLYTILETKKTGHIECRSTVKNDIRHIEVNAVPVLNEKDGSVSHILGAVRDITYKKKAELALKESEEKYRFLSDNVTDGILLFEANDKLKYISEGCLKMLDYDLNDLEWLNFDNIFSHFHQDDVQGVKDIFQAAHKKQIKSFQFTYRLRTKNGNYVWAEDNVSAEYDSNGNHVRSVHHTRNISERKLAEDNLVRSEEKYRDLFEFAADGILTGSPDGFIIDANTCFCSMSGRSREKLLGKPINIVLSPESVAKESLRFDLLLKGETVVNERELILPDGRIVEIEMRTKMMPDKTYQAIFRDISARKENERKIQQQNIELLKLNSDKDVFMSILGHDLKSQFNSLLGLSDLLKENLHDYDMANIQDIVNYINKSAQNAYKLLDSLLMWSRSQAGKIPFEPLKVSLREVCGDVFSEMNLIAETKKIKLGFNIPDELTVFADIDMLKTIFRNLLSNALKFTNSGGQISVNAIKEKNNFLISVSDTGIGIVPEILSKMFDVSQMNSTQGTEGETGTGFGLLLCKDFVEKHSGKLSVKSELGKGSVFSFSLPWDNLEFRR
jgi:PAS domain S-box-containing protein